LSTVQLAAGDAAPDSVLARPDGSAVRLSSIWGEGPLVLAFLRHFG
jgi:peroxiredoxin